MRVNTDLRRELSPAETALTSPVNCKLLLAKTIHDIQAERIDPAAFTDASYLHPNGFTRIRLPHESHDGGALYLNVWQPGVSESDVHDHAFDFRSTILSGSLRHRCWQETDPGQDGVDGNYYLHDRGNTEASTGRAKLKNLGRFTRKVVDDITFYAGDAYFLEHTQPHSVTPDSVVATRTLVHQSPDVSMTTTVFRPDGAERGEAIYTKLTLPAYVEELEVALASLSQTTYNQNFSFN